MEHHGKRLDEVRISKGFSIQALADAMSISWTGVKHDIKSEKLTRKALKKYENILGITVDDFFSDNVNTKVEESNSREVELLKQLVAEQRKRLELQDNLIRFFPKAVQMA